MSLSRTPQKLNPDSLRYSTEKGLTLLECLIAVSVMGLTIGLVLPPLFIATASRVQTRRAEQAFQIAQGEVDRIRTLVALDRHISSSLPQAAAAGVKAEDVAVATTASAKVRTSRASCSNAETGTPQPQINTAILVDIDADCQPDFLMQVFRTSVPLSTSESSKPANDQRPSQFDLGVRVYSILAGRASATSSFSSNLTGLEKKPASLGLTSGQGNQLKRPLAALYTSISWSDRDGTLCSYQQDNPDGSIESCQNF